MATTTLLPGVDVLAGASAPSSVALAYADQVFRRLREPMSPLGHEVDWADQPSRHGIMASATRVPLSRGDTADPALADTPLGSALDRSTGAPSGTVDLATLGAVLATYGLEGRRLDLNWNEDARPRLSANRSIWGRPTPSGGGMYPVESYLVTGGGPLPAGAYHYATGHHALQRLWLGDRRDTIASALGRPLEPDTAYLVATVRFWKNAFKYSSFCYHVVAQDVGALLASWRLVLAARGAVIEPTLWFDEQPVHDVLGLDGVEESAFAVVPLRWSHPTPQGPDGADGADGADAAVVDPIASTAGRPALWERSRRTRTFPAVTAVREACLVHDRPRPDASVSEGPVLDRSTPSTSTGKTLPGPHPLDTGLGESLTRRRSAFGLFAGEPLAGSDLATVLDAADTAARMPTDLAPGPGRSPWTGLHVLANRVDGLESGG